MAADSPSADGVVLGLLSGEPQSGYEMLAQFRDPTALGMIWQMSASQVYAILKRLERQGYIVSKSVPNSKGPERIIHQVTPEGSGALMIWLEEPPGGTLRRVRVEFLSRVYVAARLHLPVSPLRERQEAACEWMRQELIGQRDALQVGTVGRAAAELILAEMDVAVAWLRSDAIRTLGQ